MKIQEVEISLIKDNPFQTRENMADEPLHVLIKSIRERGLINPITVLKQKGEFIIVNGHRRFTAFKRLKKKTIPAIVKTRNLNNELMIDLVHENLVREDLNPVEKALSIRLLISQIPTTENKLDRMMGLIGKLKNYKRRGTFACSKSENTKGFEEFDIFKLDKILKSLGISENNAMSYLTLLKLPNHMRKCLVFRNKGVDKNGKILMKQAEQLARIQNSEYQEHLFQKCLKGTSAKAIQALADQHLKKVELGDWKGYQSNRTATRFKDDLERLELISDDSRKLSQKVASFKVDTLIKLSETMEKEDFNANMISLKKELDTLSNKINDKLEENGFSPVAADIDDFEVKVVFSESKRFFRTGFPMKIAKQLKLAENGPEYLKLKIVGRRENTQTFIKNKSLKVTGEQQK